MVEGLFPCGGVPLCKPIITLPDIFCQKKERKCVLMANSLSYQFIPAPTELKKEIRILSGNVYKVMDFIIDEIFSFVDTRSTLVKEFSYRYVADRLHINFGNVGRIFRKLQENNFIEILEAGRKKIGSKIRLLFGCTGTTKENDSRTGTTIDSPVSCTGTTKEDNFSCTGTTIKEYKYKEISDQESENPPSPSPDDDVTTIDKREGKRKEAIKNIIEVPAAEPIEETKPLNHSSNSLPPAAVNQISSKQSSINPLSSSLPANSINTVDNYNVNKDVDIKPVPPAPTAPVTVQGNPLASSRVQVPPAPVPQVRGNSPTDKKDKEFSSLGDILPGSFKLDTSKYSATVPVVPGVSPAVMVKSKEILIKKNLTEKEINIVFNRIAGIIKTNQEIKNKDGYFLACCNSEQEREVIPEKSLDEKEREKFIEKIYDGYRIGKIKYVVSNAGEKQPITEMDSDGFLYWKGRKPSYVNFKELAEKAPHLLDETFFIGD